MEVKKILLNNTEGHLKNLSRYLTPLNVWALAFGCVIGWGTFVVPATNFLPKAGPLGATIAIGIGALIMLVIAANYHYLMNRKSDSGGSFTFTKKIFGYDHAFICAWFLWFVYVNLLWGNVTACSLIARDLFDGFFCVGFSYNLAGYDIYVGEVFLSIAIILFVGIFCARKRFFFSQLNTLLALFILIGGLACMILALASGGSVENFAPYFAEKNSYPVQISSVVALTAWAFVGFESISHAADEFNFSPKKTFAIMFSAIIAGAIFYAGIIFLSAASVPIGFSNWDEYISCLSELEGLAALPVFHAASELLGDFGLITLGITLACAVLTSVICNYFATSRLMFALAKDECLPKRFSILNAENIPSNAVTFVMIVSLIIPFIGQTLLNWLTDVTTVGAIIAYGYVSFGAYFTARVKRDKKYMITGALGTFFSLMLAILMLAPNLLAEDFFACESYLILILLSIFGVLYFRVVFNGDKGRRFGKSVSIWIIMLFIIFTSSLIWMRQSVAQDFEVMLGNVTSYFTEEIDNFGVKPHVMHRVREENYLREQFDEVRSGIFRQSVVQVSLIVFTLIIIFNIYSVIRKRERDVEEAHIRAEESVRAKNQFLSNMSYDIKTPIKAILGYTGLALRDETSPAEIKNFLTKIESSSENLLAVINDVLEMSLMESGKIKLNEETADLLKILSDVRDIFAEQMAEKNINFTVEFSNVHHQFVRCDKHRLHRVLLNLASNAYKFTPHDGRVEIILKELHSRIKGVGNYELHIKDTGIGMSEDFAKKIFEPFEREKNSKFSELQGTGLGMAITKTIVDLMHGNIYVETKENVGTEVIVNVQFAIEAEPPKVESHLEFVAAMNDETFIK